MNAYLLFEGGTLHQISRIICSPKNTFYATTDRFEVYSLFNFLAMKVRLTENFVPLWEVVFCPVGLLFAQK